MAINFFELSESYKNKITDDLKEIIEALFRILDEDFSITEPMENVIRLVSLMLDDDDCSRKQIEGCYKGIQLAFGVLTRKPKAVKIFQENPSHEDWRFDFLRCLLADGINSWKEVETRWMERDAFLGQGNLREEKLFQTIVSLARKILGLEEELSELVDEIESKEHYIENMIRLSKVIIEENRKLLDLKK